MKMKKYVVEFIGTFFLVLAVCLAVGSGLGYFAPVAIGLMLMVMIYAGGHISGAHYNRAVSVAIYLRGKLALGELPAYIVAQVIGGILAALVSGYFLERMSVDPIAPMTLRTGPAILAEFLGTFALAFVILNVATAKNTAGNSYFGLAIGLTVTAGAYAFGSISGAVFNPAVAAGICTAGFAEWTDIWLYLAATFVGGAVAAFVFSYVNGPE
jgi:aquaporin Z